MVSGSDRELCCCDGSQLVAGRVDLASIEPGSTAVRPRQAAAAIQAMALQTEKAQATQQEMLKRDARDV